MRDVATTLVDRDFRSSRAWRRRGRASPEAVIWQGSSGVTREELADSAGEALDRLGQLSEPVFLLRRIDPYHAAANVIFEH